ncbi:MAG: hypothetical protein M3Z98_06940, partial [Candidatus Dormibacteraeota bacterium]|nr:hypothetical protein [Candidatus Dormibacteraeota bacterium]
MRLRKTLAGLLGAFSLLATGAMTSPIPAHAVTCSPYDYICQQLQYDQGQQQANADALAAIQGQIKDIEKQIKALYDYIAKLNNQLTAQQQLIDSTQAQIDALDAKIRLTEADITRRQAHLQIRETLFDHRVRSMDKHGSINYLALALSSTSFNQLIDRLITTQTLVQADHRLLDDLRLEKAQIQAAKDQLTQQRADEADLLFKQKGQQAALEQLRGQQQAALAFKQQLDAQYKAEADQLAQQAAEIKAQVAADEAAYAAEAAGSGGGTGQFGWPMNPHWISQYYGCSNYPFEMYWAACPSRHLH